MQLPAGLSNVGYPHRPNGSAGEMDVARATPRKCDGRKVLSSQCLEQTAEVRAEDRDRRALGDVANIHEIGRAAVAFEPVEIIELGAGCRHDIECRFGDLGKRGFGFDTAGLIQHVHQGY